MEKQTTTETMPIARYVHESVIVSDIGVFQNREIKKKRRKGEPESDETEMLRLCVSSVPFWLENIIQTENGETHLLIRYTAFGDEIKEIEVPEGLLADKRGLATLFYSNNIAGFGSDPVQLQIVAEYLRSSVLIFNTQQQPDAGHKHFGWTADHKQFVIGDDLICDDDTRIAHLVAIPHETRNALREYGDSQQFLALSEKLNQYKSHAAALLNTLGTPLLQLMGVDGGGVLSLSGPSGTGKTTIANFALSAFGQPRGLTASPSSTEKAILELLRIFNNLPFVINEAHTMKPEVIGRLAYAAANGEARNTLTQNVTLRESARFCTTLLFTGNGSILGLDEKFLNEAMRRRVFEISIDEPLPADLARELNEAGKDDFGHVGRRIIEEAVENTDEIKARLQRDLEWVFSQGVSSEDRFSAWMIAAAKVAGEILQFADNPRARLKLDVQAICLHAIGIVKANTKQIRTSNDLVGEAFTDFINKYHANFSIFNAANRTNGTEWINTQDCHGEIVGRVKNENGKTERAISRKVFSLWAHERGIDASHLTRYIRANNIEEKIVKLVQHGKATRCLVLPSEETTTQWPHLSAVQTPTQSASGVVN